MPGPINLYFVSGIEKHTFRFPKSFETAGLTHRFAVIQDSYVPGHGEMFFDEPLWLALVAFVSAHDASATLSVVDNWDHIGRKERPLADFMRVWETTAYDDKCPPEAVVSRNGSTFGVCMLFEDWYLIGGVCPYADSFTHSLFANRDLSEEILAFLRGHPDAERWTLEPFVRRAEDTQGEKDGWLKRLIKRIL